MCIHPPILILESTNVLQYQHARDIGHQSKTPLVKIRPIPALVAAMTHMLGISEHCNSGSDFTMAQIKLSLPNYQGLRGLIVVSAYVGVLFAMQCN
jgi:hypothetical protein